MDYHKSYIYDLSIFLPKINDAKMQHYSYLLKVKISSCNIIWIIINKKPINHFLMPKCNIIFIY